MRTRWLVLIGFALQVLALQVLVLPVAAAEKDRDWRDGQVVESRAAAGPQVHTVSANGKNYLVRGSLGNGDQDLKVGDSVRFAVEGKTMFVSIAGKEYRLNVLGETLATRKTVDSPQPETPRPAAPRPQSTTPQPAQPSTPPSAIPQAAIPQPTNPQPPAPQLTSPPLTTATPRPPAAADKPAAEASVALDNDAVVKMIVGGLKEDTVASVIGSRPGNYTLTPDALLGLKAAGVPQAVIAAMTAKMKAPR